MNIINTTDGEDISILRELAREYAEISNGEIQDRKRTLWTKHNSLKKTRPLVMASFGMWNAWCKEYFSDEKMGCEDPFYRGIERQFKMNIFKNDIGDDTILEPWITQNAVRERGWDNLWGVREINQALEMMGGACKYVPVLESWADIIKLSHPPHSIDEGKTREHAGKLQDAVGDILEVNIDRGPLCQGFLADISTCLAKLRGLEQLMIDMYESPEELHRLLAFMRDGILANQEAAEKAGDFSLTSQQSPSMTYAEELEPMKANSGPRRMKDLWGFCAAQELTLVSPEMHYEFMLQYQMPIMEKYGLVSYGCCEDLTEKIGLLRKIPNLRIIGVSPTADLSRCVEQTGSDYVLSWRPNPTDMVCGKFDETKIRKIIRDGINTARDSFFHIHLKDVETVEGEPERLKKWIRLVREEIENS